MIVLDAPLIDYVFQPIVDRLERSCFHLARFFLDGGLVWIVGDGLYGLLYGDPARFGYIVATSAISLAVMGMLRWHLIPLIERINRPGHANIARLYLFPARVLGLVLLTIQVSKQVNSVFCVGYALVMIGMYFASCVDQGKRFRRVVPQASV